jgi:hypothetical protein
VAYHIHFEQVTEIRVPSPPPQMSLLARCILKLRELSDDGLRDAVKALDGIATAYAALAVEDENRRTPAHVSGHFLSMLSTPMTEGKYARVSDEDDV